eukprot:TRINITY_DN8261_c0_g1_i1.p1 TRINITY_DN8261_c0_g1~~TRINITY_DN8261_c0_g1_i1.p1  ORF type:complete len:261 (+),score=46.35 TRINITY_DN8261_c0_g1_i1:32-784(+)
MNKLVLVSVLVFLLVSPNAYAAKVLGDSQATSCSECWDLANTVLESWVEMFLYGGTFYSCAQFCSRVSWGDGCIAVCTVLGDEAFFELLNSTDLDPIYVCEVIDACPVDDCGPQCAVFNNVTKSSDDISLPPQDKDYVTFNVTYTVTKPWTGTGVIYFQMVQCDSSNSCQFLANSFWLLQPNGVMGTFTAQFSFNYDCPVEFQIGQPITAQLFICNGNCDEYGVARHPHSALYDKTSTSLSTDGDCPDPQ